MRREADRPRLRGAALEVALASRGSGGGGGRRTWRRGRPPSRSRAPTADSRARGASRRSVEDLALAFGVVTGHPAPPFAVAGIPNGCSMSSADAEAAPAATTPRSPRACAGSACEELAVAKEPRDGARADERRAADRSGSASAGCWAGPRSCRSRAARRIYARLFLELILDDRTPAGPQGAARGGARATSSSAATSSRTTSRSSAGSTTSSSWSSPSTCSSTACPTDVLDEKLDELGIDRRAFERGRRPDPAVHAGPAPPARPARPASSSQYAGDTLEQQRGRAEGPRPGSTRRNCIA